MRLELAVLRQVHGADRRHEYVVVERVKIDFFLGWLASRSVLLVERNAIVFLPNGMMMKQILE